MRGSPAFVGASREGDRSGAARLRSPASPRRRADQPRAESPHGRGRLGEAPPVPRRRRWLRPRLHVGLGCRGLGLGCGGLGCRHAQPRARQKVHRAASSNRRAEPRGDGGAPRGGAGSSPLPPRAALAAGNCAPTGFTREARRSRPEPRAIRSAARRCRGADGDAGAERKVRALPPLRAPPPLRATGAAPTRAPARVLPLPDAQPPSRARAPARAAPGRRPRRRAPRPAPPRRGSGRS